MIQIVELESAPLLERPHVREGVFRTRRILNGVPGTPGNFSLQLGVTPSYFSPRHRHNFDQVRYQLEGDFDFAADGVMKAGTIGYFPEGTYYGPQASDSENSTLVLQFGGASGSGYIAAEEYERAAAELAKHGAFAKGVYTRLKPDGAKLNKDAYEAVWEQVNGRPLVYPPQRYTRPVFMDPASFDWMPLADRPGVSCKHLGEFSERRTQLAFFKIDPGGSLRLQDNSIYFVTRGSGSVSTGDSTSAARNFGRHATIHLAIGDHAAAAPSGAAPAEFLHIALPRFS
ncbi:MAG TPA: hypothetical protein VMD77_14815 [Candidatus Baltobacteraceae bacterium]|nr:hypothetical protein [Candidatus Baltobacteraceae bacterium]